MLLTKAQQRAIETRGCSLLLSAGAGSGKTAVLTERIVTRLCDRNDDCCATDFLVVTFTNAAAKELSDRIRRKLSERAALDPSNKKIIRNLALLPSMKISTINAFCYEMVRGNFQKLGLSASVRIADDAEIGVIRDKLMNETISDAFDATGDSDTFQLAFEIFAGAKNDKGFVDTLLELDAKLRQMPDRDSYEKAVLSMYSELDSSGEVYSTEYGRQLSALTERMLDETMRRLDQARRMCDDSTLIEKYIPRIDETYDEARLLTSLCGKCFEAFRNEVISYKDKKTPFGRLTKYARPEYAERIRKLRNGAADIIISQLASYYATPTDVLKNAALDSRDVIAELFRLTDDFAARLDKVKKELGIVDFNDVEHYVLDMLYQSKTPPVPSDFARKLQGEYREIYIDEYQDVNLLQDMIFLAMSSRGPDGEERSRFMVGDIKQSIYRFRGARPEIFNGYREEFSDIESDSLRRRIFMQDNFRCSKSVIDLTNYVFSRLMSGSYCKDDELLFSRKEKNPVSAKAKVILCQTDDAICEKHSNEEVEALVIAREIKALVNDETQLTSDGKRFTFSDFAILTRSKSAFGVYESVLSDNGIPVLCDVGESFYGKKEILLALCLLNSIDNPSRDIYLAGFMRSIPGGFSDDELYRIKRTGLKNGLYNSVRKCADDTSDTADAKLCKKCAEFITKLSGYRKAARGLNAAQLIWLLYCDMDLLNVCAAPSFCEDSPEQGANRRKNLLKLYNMARDYASTSFKGLGEFLDYINGSIEKTNIKADRIIGADCVSLMTIHRSKGLEFPVCFVSDTARQFNKTDERKKLVLSDSFGIGTKLKDTAALRCTDSKSGCMTLDTPFRKVISESEAVPAQNEEIRVLYVALTRARDRLYITACKKSFEKLAENCLTKNIIREYADGSSYIELLLNSLSADKAMEKLSCAASICFDGAQNTASDFVECEYINSGQSAKIVADFEDQEAYEEKSDRPSDSSPVNDTLLMTLRGYNNFIYSNTAMQKIPSKLTVSTLKKGLLDETGADNSEVLFEAKRLLKSSPAFLSCERDADSAEKGTAAHIFMQFADYSLCEKSGCAAEADRLLDKSFIDKRQREILNTDMLDGFFGTELYGQIRKSASVYREQRFNLDIDAFEIARFIQKNTRRVLVQGVIDLFFENPDGTYTVVDFKTDRVNKSDGEQVLKQRHSQQLMFYCRAVEEMTEKKVKRAVLFSFALMRDIDVPLTYNDIGGGAKNG